MSKKSRATILDVAKAAGVSKSTVSLVLQNNPVVKPSTREKVEKTIAELGYVYNRDAANLRNRSSNIVGLLIHDLTNPFFAELYVGLEKTLANSGHIALLSNTAENPEVQLKNFQAMTEHNTAGFIICPALGTDEAFVERLEQQNIPVVSIMRPMPGKQQPFDLIHADNLEGTFVATTHLIEQGYRNIAFIGGHDTQVSKDRVKGYKRALKKAGLEYNEQLHYRCPPNRSNGELAVRKLLNRTDLSIDACVCYNDLVALGALWGLSDLGIQVGKNFGVVGFDNVAAAGYTNPPLTSVATNPQDIGMTAAKMLLEKIQNGRTDVSHVIKPVRLIERLSSRKQS